MNLDRLPEIVEAVKPTMTTGLIGVTKWKLTSFASTGSGFAWVSEHVIRQCFLSDAANACVVAMLGRLVANGRYPQVRTSGVAIRLPGIVEFDFPGDLLNALYDAFRSHPEWFREER